MARRFGQMEKGRDRCLVVEDVIGSSGVGFTGKILNNDVVHIS
jgi:hypothetical protein